MNLVSKMLEQRCGNVLFRWPLDPDMHSHGLSFSLTSLSLVTGAPKVATSLTDAAWQSLWQSLWLENAL